MMRRTKTGIVVLAALIAVALSIGTAAALLVVSVNPTQVSVPAGGSNWTTGLIVDKNVAPAYGRMTYSFNVTLGSPYITAKLSGPYLDSNFTKPYYGLAPNGSTVNYTTTTSVSNYGEIAWYGWVNKTYYFKLTIYAQSSTPLNTTYHVDIAGSDAYVASTGTLLPVIVTNSRGTSVNVPITSEYFTLALVGVGAAAIVLLRRRGF